MELHARTRRDLEPDPEFDPICALFYCISSDTPLPDTEKTELTGVIVIDKDKTVFSQDIRYQTPLLIRSGITGLEVTYAADEKALFHEIAHIIKRYCFVLSDFSSFYSESRFMLLQIIVKTKVKVGRKRIPSYGP